MAGAVKKKQNRYTYADYLNLSDEKRHELIDGEIYNMNSPNFTHQKISLELTMQLASFFDGKPCQVICAPFDVILSKLYQKNEDIDTVVQPDIMVVCDEKKIEERGVVGAPDLVVEIISPTSAAYDNIRKRALYESFGVKEYWIISPTERLIRIYHLDKQGKYSSDKVYDDTAKIETLLFPGLVVDCHKIFPAPPKIRRVKEPKTRYL